jgi:hypothetical protein
VTVYTHGVNTLRTKDAAEGDLRTDAIAIGTQVPDDGDAFAAEAVDEREKACGFFWETMKVHARIPCLYTETGKKLEGIWRNFIIRAVIYTDLFSG